MNESMESLWISNFMKASRRREMVYNRERVVDSTCIPRNRRDGDVTSKALTSSVWGPWTQDSTASWGIVDGTCNLRRGRVCSSGHTPAAYPRLRVRVRLRLRLRVHLRGHLRLRLHLHRQAAGNGTSPPRTLPATGSVRG